MRSLAGELGERWRWGFALLIGLVVSGAVGYVLVRPLRASPVGYDTAGSVLYFQRMIGGQVLERPYGATPKPLMTLIEGVLYAVGGWTAISVAAVAVCAMVVTFASELVRRVAGPVAASFAFVALLGSQALELDEIRAYAVGWACLWLLVAGFCLTARRPRYAVAGVALCAATLTRLEVVAAVAGAVAAVAAWKWLVPTLERRWPGRLSIGPAPRGAWFLALGFLALPIMLIHDWLLTRDPLYWMHVSASYSANHESSVMSPARLTTWLMQHYLGMPLLVLLAAIGLFLLVRRRQAQLAVGLGLLGPGIWLFLFAVAARHTYVSGRYVYVADVALVVAAAIGTAVIRVPDLASTLGSRRTLGIVLGMAGAAVIGLGASVPFAPLNAATRKDIMMQRTVAQNLRAADPAIRRAVAAEGAGPVSPVILAPGLWTPRLIVDLRLRITQVGAPAFNAAGSDFSSTLHDGELIYHDRAADPVNGVAAMLEGSGPVVLGGFRLQLVASDASAGWWLYRVAGSA